MKKMLLIINLVLVMLNSVQAVEKIAIIDMNTLLQQVAQKTGVSAKLENEFKNRAKELQDIENDLHGKMQQLQHNSSIMDENERKKLEKNFISQRQIFSKKAQSFEQDHQRRSKEERNKLIILIQTAMKKIVSENDIDLVIDINSVAFVSNNIKDITIDVLRQVK